MPSFRALASGWRFHFLVLAIGVLALGLRLAASWNDLWLDEIWSLRFAQKVGSAGQIFIGIHHDNNHHLNTLLLYLLGEQDCWLIYRLPSVAAGVGTVLVAGFLGTRWGRLEALLALLLTGSSYLLIHYSSEARGYSLAVFFSFLALALLESHLARPRRATRVGFWLAVVLAVLSHLTALVAYLALLVWSLVRLVRTRPTWWQVVEEAGLCHVPPLAPLAVLYVLDFRHISPGGGPEFDTGTILNQTAGWMVGWPGSIPAAFLALALLLGGLLWLAWQRSDLWVFYLLILGLPLAMLLVSGPEVLFVRYFLISVSFGLFLWALMLAAFLRRGGPLGLTAGLVLLLFLAGNTRGTVELLKKGRGHYRAALLFMAENTSGPVLSVCSDHDFRNSLILTFYAQYLPTGKALLYHKEGAEPPEGPEWFLLHNLKNPKMPAKEIDAQRHQYLLQRKYPSVPLSGWEWGIYRRVDQTGNRE
jgi:hypothetical protein